MNGAFGPTDHILVVGASVAGLTAVETLRRVGFEGRITLVGDEPAWPYDRPPLSKRVLSGEWDISELALRPTADIAALRLDVRLGVTALSMSAAKRQVQLSDGETVSYDALVIATGVRPKAVFEPHPAVHQLRTISDAVRLRDQLRPGTKLVVVGGGLIGSEAASVAVQRGVDVTLVCSDAAPMQATVGALVSNALATHHVAHGVTIRSSVRATRLVGDRTTISAVELSDGSRVPADAVLVAAGAEPNVGWLDPAEIDVSDGVVCDEYCMVAPCIVAAGDVAQFVNRRYGTRMRIEHRTNAGEQAMAAVRNLVSDPVERLPFSPVPYFWSDQYDMKLQAYGCISGADEELLALGDLDSARFLVAFRRGDLLGGCVSAGMTPRELRQWRQALANDTAWDEVHKLIGSPALAPRPVTG